MTLNPKADRARQAVRYELFRSRVDAIKLDAGCIDCGYKENPAALQFDHIDPSTKLFRIAAASSKRWEVILAEIMKCEIRCANCHAVKTQRENRSPGRPRTLGPD